MAVDVEQQASSRAAAQPSYVFRGHAANIHSLDFVRRNTCFVSGDADGWVVCWRLESKRPLAVWRAHEAAILGTAEWGPLKFITHGRDHTLRVWQLHLADTASLSTVLPADPSSTHRPKPWLLHSLPVNTLNFCSFSMCYRNIASSLQRDPALSIVEDAPPTRSSEPILVAVPATDDKKIDVYEFPDEKLVSVVPRVGTADTGMVMAVKLVHHRPSNQTLVLAGYEGGFTAVHLVPRNPPATRTSLEIAQTIYVSQPHSQPILSLDASPDGTVYFTSSADAIIAAHRIPDIPSAVDEESLLPASTEAGASTPPNLPALEDTHDVEASSLSHSASKDANKSPKHELPTELLETSTIPDTDTPSLSFSKQPIPPLSKTSTSTAAKPAGLSSLLSSASPQIQTNPAPNFSPNTSPQPPYKSINTKHAGQQSLRTRSDGRLLVTAGWDSRVRIYSAKTLKEVAVLKWHKEGMYAVDFGEILDAQDLDARDQDTVGKREWRDGAHGADRKVSKRETGLSRLQRAREKELQLKHWVVAGSKDGKISLWEVF